MAFEITLPAQGAGFDYGRLDASTSGFLSQAAAAIRSRTRRMVTDLVEIGQLLAEVRDRLRHNKGGGFEGWVQAEFSWKRRTAYNFIAAYQRLGNCAIDCTVEMDVAAVNLLARQSTPDEALVEALELARPGRRITERLAREIVGRYKLSPESIIKPSDKWAFGHPKWPQPEGFRGSIPGEVYANALHYFAPTRGVAVDPMAGSGMLRRVYDDRARWQMGEGFDLEVRLYDLYPRQPFADQYAIARHDARQPLPVRADWIFLDPPYFGISKDLYDGPMAQTDDLRTYLALLEETMVAMAESLTAGGVLCQYLPKYAPCRRGTRYDIPRRGCEFAERVGLVWVECAYVGRAAQKHPRARYINAMAKRSRFLNSDVCELNVFQKGATDARTD